MEKEIDRKFVDSINQLLKESRTIEASLERTYKEYIKERNRVEREAKELKIVAYKSLDWEELEFDVSNLQSGVKQKKEEANYLIGIHQELLGGNEVENLEEILKQIEPTFQ